MGRYHTVNCGCHGGDFFPCREKVILKERNSSSTILEEAMGVLALVRGTSEAAAQVESKACTSG